MACEILTVLLCHPPKGDIHTILYTYFNRLLWLEFALPSFVAYIGNTVRTMEYGNSCN